MQGTDAVRAAWRARLADLGHTQNWLASQLGVTRGRVHQLLHSDTDMNVSTLEKVTEALGLKVELVGKPTDG
jgi:plasmid maintenance system antidote protein VapI